MATGPASSLYNQALAHFHSRVTVMDDTRGRSAVSSAFRPRKKPRFALRRRAGSTKVRRPGDILLIAALYRPSPCPYLATWSRLQSIVERRGHIDDAKRFTDIVAQLIAARRPADYVAPTRAELAEAERIGQLLSRP